MAVREATTPHRRRDVDLVPQFIRNLPDDLKERLYTRADTENTNLQDVAVSILAEHFQVEYSRRPRRTAGGRGGSAVTLMMPDELREKIKRAALDARTSAGSLSISILQSALA